MSSEIKWEVMEAVIGTECGIGVPGLEVVECVLDMGEEFVPHVEGECDVDGGEGGDDMVFGSADVAFGKISTVVVG